MDHDPRRLRSSGSRPYTITDRRLNIDSDEDHARSGPGDQVGRSERNFDQGVYERVMQIGDVDFDTAGTDDSNFIFAGVASREGGRAGRPRHPRHDRA
jgi:hypothetical protein